MSTPRRSDTAAPSGDTPGETRLPIPYLEFIVLAALLTSMTAMSIDMMLPSLPDIGAELRVANPNDLQLVVSVYMLGMAGGQLLWGTLSDRLGRRRPLLAGVTLFVVATAVAMTTANFPELLAARFTQGLGSAAGRIIVTAIVRDLFHGRQMARVMSLVMMVFIVVPILAPGVGQIVILIGNWRWIFRVLLAAGVVALLWAAMRLPETHGPEKAGRSGYTLMGAVRLAVGSRVTCGYGIASGFMFGCLVSYIASSQQVFGGAYGLGRLFPLAFGSVGCALAAASFTNARLVQGRGMRQLSHTALAALLAISASLAVLALAVTLPLWLALGGMMLCFFCYGLVLSNFNAIAMAPMGQIAGLAASLIGSYTSTVGAVLGTLIARQFDGTILPLYAGFAALSGASLLTVLLVEGRAGLFQGE